MGKKVELLAPAGSYETFCAVINAGADAVYAGGTLFGARAYANNFSEEDLKKAIQIAHLNNSRFYMTVNTLLKNREIEEQLFEYMRPYYEGGLDGVIVQDFGVADFFHKNFPDMELHASTQMTIFNGQGAQFLQRQGFSQVVLPRELSILEIAKIHEQTDLKLECFVHGALCYCYSGQCLLSSLLGGRSGNRGRCAQPCRLAYDVYRYDDNELLKLGYPLSLKDVCTIDVLPQLIEAGVSSLKIEGRMKQAEYAAGVTNIYRNYLNLYESNGKEGYHVSEGARNRLMELGNRSGFTNGYLSPKESDEMISWDKPSHQKSQKDGFLKEVKNRFVQEVPKTPVTIKLVMKIGSSMQLALESKEHTATVYGERVAEALKQPVTEAVIRDKMKKLGNTPFELENLEVTMDEKAFCSMTALNQLRRDGVDALLEKFQQKRVAYEILKDEPKENVIQNQKQQLSVSVFSEEQLEEALSCSFIKRIYLDCHGFLEETQQLDCIKQAHSHKKEIFLMMPVVFREKQRLKYTTKATTIQAFDGCMVRAFDEIPFLLDYLRADHIVLDANLYTWNKKSHEYFHKIGILLDTVPYELNENELRHRDNCQSELAVYGYYPLMTSAQCLQKNAKDCQKQSDRLYLKDRYKKDFPVLTFCDICANRIYNTVPTALFKHADKIADLNCQSYRMDFTLETKEEMASCLKKYQEAFVDRTFDESTQGKGVTYGHFKRGVE